MAEPVLLDASALLAYLHREPGFEVVRQAVREGAAIGAVNLAEVLGKVREKGRDAARIHTALGALGLTVLPFDEGDAALAGELSPLAKSHGLALGDRACLAQGDAPEDAGAHRRPGLGHARPRGRGAGDPVDFRSL